MKPKCCENDSCMDYIHIFTGYNIICMKLDCDWLITDSTIDMIQNYYSLNRADCVIWLLMHAACSHQPNNLTKK